MDTQLAHRHLVETYGLAYRLNSSPPPLIPTST